MRFLRLHKFFFGILLFLFVMIGGLFVCIVINIKHLKKLEAHFNAFKFNMSTLLARETAASEENVKISAQNVHTIAELKKTWINSLGLFSNSSTSIECYLNLQRDIGALKNNVIAANIVLNPECYFGFKKYLSTETLPEVEDLVNLDLQSLMVQAVIRVLIQSQPREILYVKREALRGESELDGEVFTSSGTSVIANDIFSSNLFKLSFTGTTQVLRLFINKIESMENPVFVRDIEVNKNSNAKDRLLPTKEYSTFSVTLEIFTIIDPVR